MESFSRILITAALPYANGPVHIGHLAGCYLPADIYARYQRAQKRDVKFICGSDEHGVPITIRAMKEGITPQEVVDKYHALIGDSFKAFGISFDIFSRTSSETHSETASAFFKKLYDDGIFEERESEQYFDPEKEVFLADRYIVGTCPNCGNPGAYGDQCEKCGTTLSPEQLIHPHSALSKAAPVKKLTKHWYFPLQKFEGWLREWIVDGKKDSWKSNVYGQCKSWLDSGLQARAMTRDSSWGVPVPLPDAEGKVLYVWFDAPIGYISATKELTPLWSDYWQKEDTKLVHFIGKDNIVFHCIIFPAMLKAHGGYVLPDNVPANEFLNIEGEKVSTSRNWAVWLHEYLADFPGCEDTMRYVLTANAPESKDNDFTWKDFGARANGELTDKFGNYINRALVLTHKLCAGRVPKVHEDRLDEEDRSLAKDIRNAKVLVETAIEGYKFRDALTEVIDLARRGNLYLQTKEPWKEASRIAKGGLTAEEAAAAQERIDNCLHYALQLTANLAILSNPFLPFTARKICKMLKVVDRMMDWENAGRLDLLKQTYPLPAPELLFRKIEDSEIAAQVEKLHAATAATGNSGGTDGNADPSESKESEAGRGHSAPGSIENTMENLSTAVQHADADQSQITPDSYRDQKSQIVYTDFDKIDLRVGTIKAAAKVEKADKLLKLQIDTGEKVRTVVSGIAQHFMPEEIVGKQVVVVANLAPRKMRGIESEGMILMAEEADGRLVFVLPENTVAAGRTVK